MSNPFEDFLEEYGPVEEKTAGFVDSAKGFGRDFGSALGFGAATAGASAVIGSLGIAANKIYGAATKARDFKNMMSFNPDLQEHHDRDPRLFNQMFTSLRNMNPAYSKDPLVAGTYMRQMSESPLTAGGKLTDAIGNRDAFRTPLSRAVEEGMSGAKERLKHHMKADPHEALAERLRGMQLHQQIGKMEQEAKEQALQGAGVTFGRDPGREAMREVLQEIRQRQQAREDAPRYVPGLYGTDVKSPAEPPERMKGRGFSMGEKGEPYVRPVGSPDVYRRR